MPVSRLSGTRPSRERERSRPGRGRPTATHGYWGPPTHSTHGVHAVITAVSSRAEVRQAVGWNDRVIARALSVTGGRRDRRFEDASSGLELCGIGRADSDVAPAPQGAPEMALARASRGACETGSSSRTLSGGRCSSSDDGTPVEAELRGRVCTSPRPGTKRCGWVRRGACPGRTQPPACLDAWSPLRPAYRRMPGIRSHGSPSTS